MKNEVILPTKAKDSKPITKKDLVALRDFVICWNEYYKEIKAGDDISDVPEMFYENLKTEKVI